MSQKTAWFVRAGEGAFAIDEFRDNNEAAVGWREVDTLIGDLPDDEILRRFEATFPAAKKNAVRMWAAQVRRWEKDVSVGDPIMSYDPGGRVSLFRVMGPPRFQGLGTRALWRPRGTMPNRRSRINGDHWAVPSVEGAA